jgi:UDP-glucuronate 4-epimerase
VDGVVPTGDSLSPVAPWRVVNIGSSDAVQLTDFIEAIEETTGLKATRNLMPMEPGDVPATWADASLLKTLTGYQPKTNVREGMKTFVKWYRLYHGNSGSWATGSRARDLEMFDKLDRSEQER